MSFRSGDRVFVDESKSNGYYIAAAATAAGDLASIEKKLRALRAGGRSTIHFNAEGNRRDLLLRAFCELDVRVTVYVMRGARDRVARPALLTELVNDMVHDGAATLMLERDDSLEQEDRRIIREALARRGDIRALTYGHADAASHPLL